MIRLIAGFIIGVIVSRNSQQYSTPYWGAIIFGVIIGMALFYFFGKRDKNIAVATAVATAIANATAAADARAQAIANSAVQVVLTSGHVPTEQEMRVIAAYHNGEITNDSEHPFAVEVDSNRDIVRSTRN